MGSEMVGYLLTLPFHQKYEAYDQRRSIKSSANAMHCFSLYCSLLQSAHFSKPVHNLADVIEIIPTCVMSRALSRGAVFPLRRHRYRYAVIVQCTFCLAIRYCCLVLAAMMILMTSLYNNNTQSRDTPRNTSALGNKLPTLN